MSSIFVSRSNTEQNNKWNVLFVRFLKLCFVDETYCRIVTAAFGNSPCKGIKQW